MHKAARGWLAAVLAGTTLMAGMAAGAEFASAWGRTGDRVWLGKEYWANPMEDWRVRGGRAECLSGGGDRNVNLLTYSLGEREGAFEVSVRCGEIEAGSRGGVGVRVGIRDDIDDYRGNCFFGEGIDAGIGNGQLYLRNEVKDLAGQVSMADLRVELAGRPEEGGYRLVLTVREGASGREVGRLEKAGVAAEDVVGNVAIVNNFSPSLKNGSRFWFSDWRVSGAKVEAHRERAFGPILWSMHTVSDSRGPEGTVLKMTAQMPPVGAGDSDEVRLALKRGGVWQEVGAAKIHPEARTATFRVARWDAGQAWPYRLAYTERDGADEREAYYEGVVRAEPKGRPLVIGGFTCQYHYGFPYAPLVRNVEFLNPDMLYFSGDQIYEPNGGYGIVQEPADRAILCFLRKWYMFGWAFGDVMRDRPTVCLPDDHDVFHGNLWGEEGELMPKGGNTSTTGGYREPVAMVNVVHRVNTSHHPAPADPRPCKNGISVYYGDLVYGRVSFGIVADRQFKSGPEHVDTGRGRADLVYEEGFDTSKLDKEGLELLGGRQEEFLREWGADWRGADMKVLLSQTLWANVNTQTGGYTDRVIADLDAGGWPQTARNRAIEIVRKAFALHLCGDQHLTMVVQYGVDAQRDSCWAFCTPAITVGWQRWWMPDAYGFEVGKRPEHGRANTGEYVDGMGNYVYVYAVANPEGTQAKNRYEQAQVRVSGFGVVRVDTKARTYTAESYRFLPGPEGVPVQFEGWPVTVGQMENYGRERYGRLGEVEAPAGVEDAVVEVVEEGAGELVYAVRVPGRRWRPFVLEPGRYTVKIGDPDTGAWKTVKGLEVER